MADADNQWNGLNLESGVRWLQIEQKKLSFQSISFFVAESAMRKIALSFNIHKKFKIENLNKKKQRRKEKLIWNF